MSPHDVVDQRDYCNNGCRRSAQTQARQSLDERGEQRRGQMTENIVDVKVIVPQALYIHDDLPGGEEGIE